MSGGSLAAPLSGRRILVTRPSGQAQGLAALIHKAGGEPVCIPAIEIRGLSDLEAFFSVADRLDSFDLAIFVSRNAVRKAMALLRERRGDKPWPAQLKLAAVGQGSRGELAGHGFSGVIAPPGRSDSEALLALPELASVAGKRVVIFRGEGGRKLLGETLAARGAQVEYAACYCRARPENSNSLRDAWSSGALDAVAVSSAEGLANLVELLGETGPQRLSETALFVPHPRVAQEAARLGLRKTIVAGPGDEETVAALVAYFGGAR